MRSRLVKTLAMVCFLLCAGLAACADADKDSASVDDEPVEAQVAAAHRVSLQLEPGWDQAAKSLTPKLLNPKELISVGTFHMNPSAGPCAQLPARAYEEMGRGDGLITIMQRLGGQHHDGYPPRPSAFHLAPTGAQYACAPTNIDTQQFIFRDSGRNFYAYVALGERGPLEQAQSILNSFRATPPERPTFIEGQPIPQRQAKFNLLGNRAVYLRTARTEIPPGTTEFEIGACPQRLKVRTLLPLASAGGNPTTSPRHDYRSRHTAVTFKVTNEDDSAVTRRFFIACAPRSSFDDS